MCFNFKNGNQLHNHEHLKIYFKYRNHLCFVYYVMNQEMEFQNGEILKEKGQQDFVT